MGRTGRLFHRPRCPHQPPAVDAAPLAAHGRQENLSARENALREDLGREYYAILGVVTEYDKQLIIVKGWSVTLSLAGLAIGFQQQHYALFALAGVTALAFWYVDARMKGFQLHYYWRMSDIEAAAFHLDAVLLDGLGQQSAPRIDMTWGYKGDRDMSTAIPARRSPDNVRRLLRRRVWMPQVAMPHAVAVLIGIGLYVAALKQVPGLNEMKP